MPRKLRDSGKGTRSTLQIYLCQFSYTARAWEDMLRNRAKRDRVSVAREIVESLGGCFPEIRFCCENPPEIKEKFISFGEHDVVVLLAFPHDQAAASFGMLISAGGGVKSFRTTRLLPWDQAMESMAVAGRGLAGYLAPGK